MPFLNTIFDLVFPKKCILCGKGAVDLCFTCLSGCPGAERESDEWIFPLFDYRDPTIKKALWLLKYKGKRGLANVFGQVLYGKIMEELSELSLLENFTDAILIPIPLSPKRRRERGFNQAELICRELIKIDQKENHRENKEKNNFRLEKSVLIKPKDTLHQARIRNRSERLKNLTGSFGVKNEYLIKNKNVILIDDITTTGATLTEARKILRGAGARKVIAFTVAH